MSITIIAAVAENGCIVKDGKLPWHLPEDLKHFKEVTTGNTVIMGRKTWESLPEKFRPLPHRKNVVITRQLDYSVPQEVSVFSSLESALNEYAHHSVMIIGGAEIYRQAFPLADKLELTRIHQRVEGDAFFPIINSAEWKEARRENHEGYSFFTYERIH